MQTMSSSSKFSNFMTMISYFLLMLNEFLTAKVTPIIIAKKIFSSSGVKLYYLTFSFLSLNMCKI